MIYLQFLLLFINWNNNCCSLWKQFSKDRFGTVVKPPKSVVPKIPWNKGLRGITSLKEFEDILPSENNR